MILPPFRECEPMSPTRAYVPPGAAAVLTLHPSLCRWPLGDVADESFRFCLAPREGKAYCAPHAKLARRSR